MYHLSERIAARIEEFKQRVLTEREWCEQLFHESTVRLLASKYAYYVLDNPYESDAAYDIGEASWYVIGRGLGVLHEDDTSPCVGFDPAHPLAKEAEALAFKLSQK